MNLKWYQVLESSKISLLDGFIQLQSCHASALRPWAYQRKVLQQIQCDWLTQDWKLCFSTPVQILNIGKKDINKNKWWNSTDVIWNLLSCVMHLHSWNLYISVTYLLSMLSMSIDMSVSFMIDWELASRHHFSCGIVYRGLQPSIPWAQHRVLAWIEPSLYSSDICKPCIINNYIHVYRYCRLVVGINRPVRGVVYSVRNRFLNLHGRHETTKPRYY